ncbi:MAG: SH3 domain-containing protein [Desulfovibrio sp.]|nr:SH3 domain-containing protein [Desulfovibrio sp.]
MKTVSWKKRPLALFCLLLLCFSLMQACSGKTTPQPTTLSAPDTRIADLKTFPQNLDYYAKKIGKNKRLLTEEQQLAQNRRFDAIFFGPWEMSQGVTKKSEACIRKARGYKLGGLRWPQEEWDVIVDNAGMEDFPSLAKPAITLRNTDLRQMPTHEARYDKVISNEHSYPFDDFQYSLFPVGTPLFITHASRDGRWYFVENPVAGGWVDANDVAPVDEAFMEAWRSHPLAAMIEDQVRVKGLGTPLNIGTVLPMVGQAGSKIEVLLPVRGQMGTANYRKVSLTKQQAAPKPLPLTAGNVAKLGSYFMNQAYGWGGMYGLRDCSATTRELLTPFGIFLPRNSRAQARTGEVVSLEGLSSEEKNSLIQEQGTPFLSLVGLPGHITMYVGNYNGQVAIMHNTWGLRTIEGSDDNARHVIGKTVVTSISPGLELPNLYRTRTFVDRIRALATPGAR